MHKINQIARLEIVQSRGWGRPGIKGGGPGTGSWLLKNNSLHCATIKVVSLT